MSPKNVHTHRLTYMRYLSVWIGFVALMAFGNTFQCFFDHSFLSSRLYTISKSNVNGLVARLFGIWTLVSGALRLVCAFNIYNKPVYNLTLMTFVVVLIHFVSEIVIFRTTQLCVGVMAPLLVSGISIAFMIHGYNYLNPPASESGENEDTSRKFKRRFPKEQ